MTARESRLAIVMLTVLGVAAVGFFAYQLYWKPMQAKERRLEALRDDIDKQAVRLKSIRDAKPKLNALTAISLPADVDLARREYEEEMSKLLRKSGLEQVTVLPKPPDTKTVPTYPTKKPIYTRLVFTVSAKGDLASVVDWLEKFYKMRLLHQVRNLSLSQAQRADPRDRDRGDLDVTATIEALVLDKAEARKTLLPEKAPQLPPLLAQPERQYASVAGKNIFFGSPRVEQSAPTPTGPDVTQFIKLDSITIDPSGPVATLFDAYHNHDYQIRARALGGIKVEVSYYINGRKRSLRSGKDLELHDDQGEVERSWAIVRIDDRQLILREGDHYFALHVGQTLAEMHPLTKDDVAALGIKEEPKSIPPAEEP